MINYNYGQFKEPFLEEKRDVNLYEEQLDYHRQWV